MSYLEKFAYIPQTCFISLEVVIEDIFYKLYLFYQCNIYVHLGDFINLMCKSL